MSDPREKKIAFEKHIRFSESSLWELQRCYYDKVGIDAWINVIPFYITSNPFIATAYAQITTKFIRDWIEKNPEARKHSFYIVEFGAGPGRFGYYTIKAICELLHAAKMSDVLVCYVMTDCTRKNVEYYKSHPALQSYIDKGLVDFAVYDLDSKLPINLLKKNISLSPGTLFNPLIIFGNYMLDSITHDLFSCQDGKLNELLLNFSTDENNLIENIPTDLSRVTVDYFAQEIEKKVYYDDKNIDSILELYKDTFQNTSFSIPIGAIRVLDYLKSFSGDKLLLITTDKGYTHLESLDYLSPSISFHEYGCFSMMLNFHAIARYCKNSGGDYFFQTPRPGIKSAVFCCGFKLEDFTSLGLAVNEWIEEFSPVDYFNLHRQMSDMLNTCNLEAILSHLSLSHWCPNFFLKASKKIIDLLASADSESIEFLSHNMAKLASNYYFMPKSECVLFEIGVFFHAIKKYAEALEYYGKAKPFVGEQFGFFYNTGLCLYHVGKKKEALLNFKNAFRISPDSKETQKWIEYLEETISDK